MPSVPTDPQLLYDLGHRGDIDRTTIAKFLAMTPTQRLRHHERWRAVLWGNRRMPNFLEEIVGRLTREQVEFVIVGGVSAVLQGAEITTRNLDICYRRTHANIVRLVTALAPLHPRPRGWPPELPFTFDERTVQLGSNFTLEIGDESLDLLGEMSAIGGYDRIIGQTVDLRVAGLQCKLLLLAQLIVSKEAAGRTKDLAGLPTLRATLEGLQKGQRTDPPGTG